jgi:hypothetical protein
VGLFVPLGSAAPADAGAVTITPGSLTFPARPVGTRSDALSVTVTNTGLGPVTISTVHITGPDAADFGEGAMCPVNPDPSGTNSPTTTASAAHAPTQRPSPNIDVLTFPSDGGRSPAPHQHGVKRSPIQLVVWPVSSGIRLTRFGQPPHICGVVCGYL